MDWTVKEWIEILGVVVLPIVGFAFTIVLNSLRKELADLHRSDEKQMDKLEELQKENTTWHAEIPEKYARRDDLEKSFQQLTDMIVRLDRKVDLALHRVPPSEE